MKRLFGAAILAAAVATPAMSADLIVDMPVYEEAMAVAGYDWNGFYAGVQLGYGAANVDRAVLPPNPPFTNSYSASGWLVGAHLGVNYHMDSFVLGVEGDVNWTNISGNDAGVGGSVDSLTINSLGSIRARAGFTADTLLIYATAGLAVGGVTATNDALPESISGTHIGWTAGIGAEVAVTEDIRLRAEYRYYDLGTQDYAFTGVFPASNRVTAHTGTIGLSFAF